MNTTEIGRKAERAASVYLEMRGYNVLERNWRRPRCEIDIVASKDNTIYFIEVKYRKNDDQGGGLEAITGSKLLQMRRAAWAWVDENKYSGEYGLSAIEVAGSDFVIMSFVDDII